VRRVKIALAVVAGFAVLVLLFNVVQQRCWTAWRTYDLDVKPCPAGEPRLEAGLSTSQMRRGATAELTVRAAAVYPAGTGRWRGDGTGLSRAPVGAFETTLVLRLPDGGQRDLSCEWLDDQPRGTETCQTTLPDDLPDGSTVVEANVQTGWSEAVVVGAEVGFYRPADVHVLTDRPLYEPGDVVQFRALVLGANGEGPLGERPGRWQIFDAEGMLVHESRGSTGPHGVADSDLPLSADAPHGEWRVHWETGEDLGVATIQVRPFTLPRAELVAEPSQRWFREGEAVSITGRVASMSGVPLAGSEVSLELWPSPDWPLPLDWADLPPAVADASGRFAFQLSPVPEDLVGREAIRGMLRATTDDGERIASSVQLVLTEDPIWVDAVTELGDGLVPDLSNRVYLRVMEPDGRPLRDASVAVANRWDARDLGQTFSTDADGVLAMNIDPGQAVQVLVPAKVVREKPAPPVPPAFRLSEVESLVGSTRGVAQALEVALESAEAPCGWRVERDRTVSHGVSARGGRVQLVTPSGDELSRCLARAIEGRAHPDGVFKVDIALRRGTHLPRLSAEYESTGTPPGAVREAVMARVQEAEGCVQGRADGAGSSPFVIHWTLAEGAHQLVQRRIDLPREGSWPETACIQRALAGVGLPRTDEDGEPLPGAAEAVQGTLRFRLAIPSAPRAPARPKPTTTTAFEYRVAADGVGETIWRAVPGEAPLLRLRPSVVLLDPGEAFSVSMLRGPGFSGSLPAEITVRELRESHVCPRTPEVAEGREDAAQRYDGCPAPTPEPEFDLVAPETGGFVVLEAGGASATVYVRPTARHSLSLSTAEAAYRPGETAMLEVRSEQPAIVSLTGVDTALGQLASLPSVDALARLSLDADTGGKVLRSFDALALATGGIAGDNAAMATLQRVSVSARARRTEPWVSGEAQSQADHAGARDATFAALLGRVRKATSASEEPIDYEAFAALWDAEAEAELDPFGLPLSLGRLPDDLLELADPRYVVVDASRLPEDLEPWQPWVRRTRDD